MQWYKHFQYSQTYERSTVHAVYVGTLFSHVLTIPDMVLVFDLLSHM